jgi:hypothetical protein
MRKGFLATVAGLFAGAGLALAQAPSAPRSPYSPIEFPAVAASALAQAHLSPAPAPVDSGLTGANGLGSAPGQSASADPAPLSAGVADGNHGPSCDLGCKYMCGPPGRIWGSAEYLLWWTREMKVPPLVTAGPLSATGPILGAPGTTVLFGGHELDDDFMRSGGRFTLGFWLNDCQTKGIEASYFFLGSRSTNFNASSSGAPGSAILGRPFFDTSTGTQGVELLAVPGFASGSVNVGTTSSFQGAEVNGICNLCCCCCNRLDLLIGPRWLQLDECITITEDTTILANPTTPAFFAGSGLPVVAGDHIVVSDRFCTHNDFYGAQIGARYELRHGNFFVDLLGKVALGVTHETLDVSGSTTVTPPGGTPVTTPGGLFALPGNIGHFTHDEFSVVPEVGINVGYQVTHHLRAFVGYTFIYWSDVARPADQINQNVNSTLIPTSIVAPSGPPTQPLAIRDTPFWAHGFNAGLEFRF